MSKYLKKIMAMILFGLSVTVYSLDLNTNDYFLMGDIGVSYNEADFHFDLMGSYGLIF
jgi:hypothetical protein